MFISPAYAQTATQGSSAMGLIQFAPMVLLFVAFYFLLIRPQQKRMKELQNAVNAVKKGDTVVTAGGLIGKVTKVTDDEVELDLSATVKGVRAVKATLQSVQPLGGKPAND